ncbi:MAG: hypothetical protein N4A46_06200 [Schleiferiaceae bacterium]|jgi:hypothetical protein|nr:hypothetical protein [Schleiferiaceae bacterium]
MSQEKLKGIVRLQSFAIVVLTIAVAYLFLDRSSDNGTDVIRTKGIVIEDLDGKERILIGAPIPTAENRVRTDLKRVEETYGQDFPPEVGFMDIYKNKVQNEMTGMLILSDNGFDKVAIGDPVPDPYFGQRIGPASGVIINDSLGAERSGYGLLKLKDRYRVTLGFDRATGYEGMTFGLDDNGETLMQIVNEDFSKRLQLGYPVNNQFGLRLMAKDTVEITVK